jgi:hypothetical protein
MICFKCGAQNADTISYCTRCGTNLEAVRSALLSPPPQMQVPQVAGPPRYVPLVLILTTLFGFLGFSTLFGLIVAIIAIGSESNSRLDPPAIVALSLILGVSGMIGLVMIIRTMLRMISSGALSGVAQPQAQPQQVRQAQMSAPPQGAALPPPREPLSVVEHTTANLPQYAPPSHREHE